MSRFLLFLAIGCGSNLVAPETSDSALNSRIAVSVDTDVQSVQLTATEVDCVSGDPILGGASHTGSADLLGMSLADFGLAIDPLSSDSTHDFTDIFMLVEPGCYDIVGQPLDANGTPSEDCSIAISEGAVEVVDGQTTEIIILSQCAGEGSGGLDTIVAFNDAPTIVDFTYEPSKFTTTCDPVIVCAEAFDPNGDPMAFSWTVDPGSFTVVSSDQTGNTAIECIEIASDVAGDASITVTVQDLLADGTPIEDYLAAIGNPVPSRDDLTAPLHVSGVDGDGDADGDGVCDSVDLCDGDDNLDADGDGVPDACDICELGDDHVDLDANGVPDACEPCDDFVPSEFQWVEWDGQTPGNAATGNVAGISVTYTSSSAIEYHPGVYNYGTVPATYGVPNNNPTIRNSTVSQNTLTFASPVVDPVLVFSSVGNPGLDVPVVFGQNIDVMWSQDVNTITSNSFTGREGFAVVRIPGVHSSIDFNYQVQETYATFVFGAAGDATADQDGDGIPDVCDPCVDDPDPTCM